MIYVTTDPYETWFPGMHCGCKQAWPVLFQEVESIQTAFEWTLKYTLQSTTGSGTRCVMILMELGENTKWNLIYCSLTYLCFWLYRELIVFLNPMTKKKKKIEGLSVNSQEMFVELHRDQFNTLKLNTILFRQIIFEEYFQTWIG